MEQKIEMLVQTYPNWKLQENILIGDWKFTNFEELRALVGKLCDLANEINHHPTVTYGYNTLHVATTTHDAGNTITDKDIALASRVSEMIDDYRSI